MTWTFGQLLNQRLAFVADMNFDGAVTVSDVWLWIKWLYFIPGDFLILAVIGSAIGNFFEVSFNSLQGGGSAVFSLFGWLFLIASVANGFEGSRRVN